MGKDLKGKELGKYISQRTDGRYQARFTNRFKKRQCFINPDLKEVTSWLCKALWEDGQGLNVKDEDITLNEWFEEWLQLYKAHCRNTTIKTYTKEYDRIRNFLGDVKLVNLNMRNIQTAILEIKQDNARKATLSRLRDILDKAVKSELLVKNYAALVTIPKGRSKPEQPRVMTVEETNLLLEEMKDTSSYFMVVLSLRTGMRIGEVLSLEWDCIDWKKKQIHVKQTLCKINGKYEFHPPKSDSGERYIPMNTDVEALLKKQFEKKQDIIKSGKTASPEFVNLVFVTRNNRPVNRNGVHSAIETAVKKINKKYPDINFEPVHPHTLRHTFATRALENGIPIEVVQSLLGHGDIQMTRKYCHVLQNKIDSEMKKMERFSVSV